MFQRASESRQRGVAEIAGLDIARLHNKGRNGRGGH